MLFRTRIIKSRGAIIHYSGVNRWSGSISNVTSWHSQVAFVLDGSGTRLMAAAATPKWCDWPQSLQIALNSNRVPPPLRFPGDLCPLPRSVQRRTFSSSGNFPILFDLVLRNDHKSVLRRVRSHPREATYRHPRGWTALHCCAEYGAPLEVVKEMVKAYPEAMAVTDWKKRTPEDVALHNETREFLRQEASKRDAVSKSMAKTSGVDGSKLLDVDDTSEVRAPLLETKQRDDFQRLLPHITKLSENLSSLESTCRSLRREIEELSESLQRK